MVSAPPFALYFFPYYVFGVTAVFAHIAAAARFSNWREPAKTWHKTLPFIGFVFGLAVVSALSLGSASDLPLENRAYLSDSFGY